jgi:hypothetical protein
LTGSLCRATVLALQPIRGAAISTVGRARQSAEDPGVGLVDMNLEIVVVPISDVDRAKGFPRTHANALKAYRAEIAAEQR